MGGMAPVEQQYSSSVGVDENGDVVYHHEGGVRVFGQEQHLVRMEDGQVRVMDVNEQEVALELQYEEVPVFCPVFPFSLNVFPLFSQERLKLFICISDMRFVFWQQFCSKKGDK